MKSFWKVGIGAFVVLAIAGTAASIVAAQTGGSTPTATQDQSTATTKDAATSTPKSSSNATPTAKDQLRDQFLNDLANNLGVSRDQLDKALTKSGLSMVDKALADGKITQDEANKIKDKINSGNFPFIGGFGHGYKMGFRDGFREGANLDDIAKFLSVDATVVRDGLMNNQSLAQIAQAHGKSRDDLKNFLISNVTDKVNQAVKDQNITQKRADEALQNFKDNVDNLIDHQGAPFRGGGRHGDFGGKEGNDDDNGSTPATPSTPGTSATTTSLTV